MCTTPIKAVEEISVFRRIVLHVASISVSYCRTEPCRAVAVQQRCCPVVRLAKFVWLQKRTSSCCPLNCHRFCWHMVWESWTYLCLITSYPFLRARKRLNNPVISCVHIVTSSAVHIAQCCYVSRHLQCAVGFWSPVLCSDSLLFLLLLF